jgi:hypothetical protein
MMKSGTATKRRLAPFRRMVSQRALRVKRQRADSVVGCPTYLTAFMEIIVEGRRFGLLPGL